MSKYTVELRYLVESKLDSLMLPYEEEFWFNCYKDLGLDDYPIFDELYRTNLNNKIIRHFYTREIGAETPKRFRMFMRDALWNVMPWYNQLYESEIIAKGIQPLRDRYIEVVGNSTGNNNSDTNTTNQTSNMYQDTPSSEMRPDDVRNMRYLTNISVDDGNGNSSTDTNYSSNVNSKETGFTTPEARLIIEYRKSFLNIDYDILHDREITECFMNIW